MRARFGPVDLDLLDGWADVTEDLASEGEVPFGYELAECERMVRTIRFPRR